MFGRDDLQSVCPYEIVDRWGTMNRAGLVAAVYNRVGVASTDGQLTPTVLGQLINDANHAIEVMEDWPWLAKSATFMTVTGVGDYPMPADWLRTDEVLVNWTDGSTPTLEHLSPREINDRFPFNNTAQPEAWSVQGDRMLLRSVPEGAYQMTHWYYRTEPDLFQDTDTPVMPASFHTAIVELATTLAARRVQQEGRAVSAQTAFDNLWLPRLQGHRRRFSGPIKVRVRPGYMGP